MSPRRRLAATRWLTSLERSVEAARETGSSDAVHDLRTGCARLDAWLRLGGRKTLRDDLRWLRRRASAVRDVDVVLAAPVPPEFGSWLRRRRGTERRRLATTLGSSRVQALLRALALLPPLEGDPRPRVREAARTVLRRARRATARPSDLAAFHALRRSARRLRYALDCAGERTGPLDRVQSVFGETNDRAVALRLIDAWPGADGATRWRSRLQAAMREGTVRSLAEWEKCRRFVQDLASP